MRIILFPLAACLAAWLMGGGFTGEPADYAWAPERPITIIVPWARGGSTDQIVRLVAGEIEAALQCRVVVVNKPGRTGSVGTARALEAEPNGYTWTSGSAAPLGVYPVLGMLETRLDDWHLFLAVVNTPVISVRADSAHEDFVGLMADLKAYPGRLRVATSGTGSTGHKVMELICRAAGGEYQHAGYDGGQPAVASVVAGESDVTAQLASEQAELIRRGQLRPLAAFSREPLEIEGYGRIPPVTDWLPDVHILTDYFGIWTRRDVPDEVIHTLQRVWKETLANSETLGKYARRHGAVVTPYYGEEARRRVGETVRSDAWLLDDLGLAEVSPETLGIPRLDPRPVD